jgi:hypothetical protein
MQFTSQDTKDGGMTMKRTAICLAALCAFALMLAIGARAAADAAKVAGAWELTWEGGQGTVTQTMTIEQDGSKIKGTLKGERGEAPFEGSLDTNKISFTAKRQTPNGEITIEYTGTVDGDSMKGTMKSPRGERPWTAKRSK